MFSGQRMDTLNRSLKRTTLIQSGILAVLVVAFWTWLEVGSLLPQPALEDAAMLFRYAENLANGGGIAWNYGEQPGRTDGATDLGFVLTLAPLVWVGVPVTFAAWMLNVFAVFGLGLAISLVLKKLLGLPHVITLLFVILVMSGYVNRYVTSGFSPPIFALLLTSIIGTALYVVSRKPTTPKFWLFLGLLSGVAGWWRPEGFAIGPLLALFTVAIGLERSTAKSVINHRNLAYLGIGIVSPFLAWVVFRVIYFGHLLPSSAVMKSGSLTRVNFLDTLQFLILALLPVIAVVVVIGFSSRSRIPVFLIALFAFSLMWVPVTLHLNWWNRMQWPLVIPLGIMGIAAVRHRKSNTESNRSLNWYGSINLLAAVLLAILSIVTLRSYTESGPPYTAYEPHTAIALALEEIDTFEIRLATSEAGLVPLAITGPAIDTYGFNNYAIASTTGKELGSELVKLDPNVIVVNGRGPDQVSTGFQDPTCKDRDMTSYSGAQWVEMTDLLMDYAEKNNMRLIRSTETGSCNAFSIFVSDEVSPEVVNALKTQATGSRELM